MTEKRRDMTLLLGSLEGGGVLASTVRLGAELARQRVATTLVSLRGGHAAHAQAAGCRVVDLNAARTRAALPRLVRYLRRERPAVMISAQTHVNALAIAARWIARYPGCLIVSERVALRGVMQNRPSVMERMRPVLARLLYPFASGVVAVSREAADDLQWLAGLRQRVQVIESGIDVKHVREMAAEQPEHLWLQQHGLKVLVAAGRLAPQKNFAMLVRAFARLELAEARLIVLGEGPERKALRALCAKLGVEGRVDLAGHVGNPFAYFARCDAFVLPSRWEGFANVVIEALACGAPVVATDCPGGPGDILRGTAHGRLVPVDDEDAMARAVAETLGMQPDRKAIAAFGARYSIDKTARKYIELAETLLDRAGLTARSAAA